jgi:hypothetical protein
MAYHGIWFAWSAYDQVFAHMPCGTFHAFIGFVLCDPSETFWAVRDWLYQLGTPLSPLLVISFPLVALLVVPEMMDAVQSSATYQYLLSFEHSIPPSLEAQRLSARTLVQDRDDEYGKTEEELSSIPRKMYAQLKRVHGLLRKACMLPEGSWRGIRLITPVDVQERR